MVYFDKFESLIRFWWITVEIEVYYYYYYDDYYYWSDAELKDTLLDLFDNAAEVRPVLWSISVALGGSVRRVSGLRWENQGSYLWHVLMLLFTTSFRGICGKPINYDASHTTFKIHLSFLYLWFLLMLKVKMEQRLISLFISCRLVSVVSSRCPSRRSRVEEEAHFMTNTYTLKQNCCVCYVQVTSYSPICFCLEMID